MPRRLPDNDFGSALAAAGGIENDGGNPRRAVREPTDGTPSQEQPVPSFGAHADTYADTFAAPEEADAGQVAAPSPAPAAPPAPSFSFSASALTVLNSAGGLVRGVPSATGILMTALAYGAQGGEIGQFMLQELAATGACRRSASASSSSSLMT
jgi:hypothetical protein